MSLRSFHHSDFPADRLRDERTETISVCVPAREEAATIAGVVGPLVALRERGVVDQVVVVDASSADGTASIAAALGAETFDEATLLPEFGPVVGKGDAMWRALSVLAGDLVCFVDGDTEEFHERFACGVLGPLVCEPRAQFVKGFFRRPFRDAGGGIAPTGGGRVTELTARPLLHDRRIPRSRANIDHIAIARSGVWVVDAKRYKGKVAVSRPLFGKAKLTIAGRDKSTLMDGLAKQVGLVSSVVAEMAPSVPVHGALCFVDADLPMVGTLSFNGYPLLYPKALAKRMRADGPLDAEQLRAVAAGLARGFPPA